MGFVSIFMFLPACCPVIGTATCLMGLALGTAAFRMAESDLQKMAMFTMDNSGKSTTKTGANLGLAGLCLNAVFLLISLFFTLRVLL